jgi:mono/diheme cytochrome c family protein
LTRSSRPLRKAGLFALVFLVAALAAGCGAVDVVSSGDAAKGKALFKQKCGSCHTLADAGTTGTIGPNLDAAFAADRSPTFASGDTEQTIRDVVRGQIAYAEQDPGTGKTGMPPDLIVGQDARNVAVYVARCAAVKSCGVK